MQEQQDAPQAPPRRGHLRMVAVIFVTAVAVRCALVPLFVSDPTGSGGRRVDLSKGYYPFDIVWLLWGRELVAGSGGVYGQQTPWGWHYPYGPATAYLSWLWAKLFGPSVTATKAMCAAGDLAALVLVYVLLLRLGGRRAALFGAMFCAWGASGLLVGSVLGKEDTLVAASILLTVWLVLRTERWALAAAAAAAALSFTIKPALAFAAVPLGVYLLQRRGVRGAAAFGLVFVLATGLLGSVEWARSGTLAYAHIGEQVRRIRGQSIFALPGRIAAAGLALPGKGLFLRLDEILQNHAVDAAVLAALYLPAMWLLWRRNRHDPRMLLLKGCAVGLVLGATVKAMVYVQYHMWSVPFLLMLAAIDLADGGRKPDLRRVIPGAALIAASMLWFSLFLWVRPLAGGVPDPRNLLFIAAALAGTVLLIPGWCGRGLGLLLAGALLFHLEFGPWSDRLLGVQRVRFAEGANWLLSVLLYYGGSAILVLRQFRRAAPAANARCKHRRRTSVARAFPVPSGPA